MNHLFTISGRVLKALQSVAAGKTDSRYYIHGIHAKAAAGELVLEATSGAVLLRYITMAPQDSKFDLILPPLKYAVAETTVRENGSTVLIEAGGYTMTVNKVDAEYLYTDKVIPKDFTGKPQPYGASLLATLLGAINDIYRAELGRKAREPGVSIVADDKGVGRIIVHNFPHIVAVIAPLRI